MRASVFTILMAFLLAAGIPFGAMAGPAPDVDSDTVPDAVDNCLTVPNGAVGQPVGSIVAQCDTDPDTNDDGVTGTPDYGEVTAGITGALPGHPTNDADTNCDGVIGTPDYGTITAGINNGNAPPGPSGLWCAGTVPCP